MENEVWKPAVGFEGHYEVSDMGKVRTLLFRNRMATIQLTAPKILKQYWRGPEGREYLCVSLGRKNKRVHVLVLETFIGVRPFGLQSAHGDGDRSNNVVTNLRWATPKDNCADRIKHGRQARGSLTGNSKLTEMQVLRIRELKQRGWRNHQLAKEFRVSACAINDILRGRRWNWLKEEAWNVNHAAL